MPKDKETPGKRKNKKKIAGKRRLINRLRVDASVFLSSEEGKIVKKDIVKTAIALGLVASASAFDSADAQTTHVDTPAVPPQNTAHGDAVTHILHNDGASSGHSSGSHTNVAHGDSPGAPHTDAMIHSDVPHRQHGSGGWC